ncbi:MAG TPA: class I SAM-dependent methyltransferase [Bacteroidales bacterium]|nr:class I SAM-dependent methyltransferase [Bacteroidales bacterium]
MELKHPLPPGRSYDQLLNHYNIEKALAEKLKNSDRETRRHIFASMYDELFSKVPDHPRLTQRSSDRVTAITNKVKASIIDRFIDKLSTYVEFAPGDCRFAIETAKKVNEVFGIDISDQRNPADIFPQNFKLIIYDGYSIPELKENTIDIVFSYQLIEHLHPEDTKLHFELVNKILKPGGRYVFQTPHALSGPYDISMFFSDEPEGFHLKEWKYSEIKSLVKETGYSSFQTRWSAGGFDFQLPYLYFFSCESLLRSFPKPRIKKVAKRLIPMLYGVAVK